MIHKKRVFLFLIIFFIVSNGFSSISVFGCKDIVAVGDATIGDFNLLLKVRDPSRPGLQVLCIVPNGYSYSYHHPWTGKKMKFQVENKFIGVTTKGDTIPNIVKPGMALSDSGIAYGDADTNSNWKNPTRNAWDDFDWIRYACQKADSEEEAVRLLTEDLVDKLHASAVSENLFVVGPIKAFVIEADAFHYKIREVDDIEVMSNYPKELWKTQRHKKFLISSSFDIKKEKYVSKGRTIRLKSFYGVKIVDIGDDFIIARQVPFIKFNKIPIIVGQKVKIGIDERATVGDFSVELLDINGRKAKISICNVFKAWEEKMLEHIQPHYGIIDLKEMINWSRMTSEDLDGLRPMCENIYPYESVMIYKIPNENYEILSSGWFSANHASSSIYVPTHICNTEILDCYENGDAAKLSLDLYEKYGDDVLLPYLENVEDVFLYEMEKIEDISLDFINDNNDVSEFLTIIDNGFQKQAIFTQKIWDEIQMNDLDIIKDLWKYNYSISIDMMGRKVKNLSDKTDMSDVVDNILIIVTSICETRMNAVKSIGFDISTVKKRFDIGKQFFDEKQYDKGFKQMHLSYNQSCILLENKDIISTEIDVINKNLEDEIFTEFNIFLLIILLFVIIGVFVKKKFEK